MNSVSLYRTTIRGTLAGVAATSGHFLVTLRVSLITAVLMSLVVSNVFGKDADSDPDVGAITKTPTNSYSPGKAIWLDLVTTDIMAATKFYGGVFGWSFSYLADQSYATASSGNHLIGGITSYNGDKANAGDAQWLISFSSSDIDADSKKVAAAGGKILKGPLDLKGRGKMVVISDSAGAELILLQATGGDPEDRPASKNEWLWSELWTPEPSKAAQFYADALGYQSKTITGYSGKPYLLLGKKGVARAGVVDLTYKDVDPIWLPYLLVEDVGKTIASIEKYGGKLVLAPSKDAVSATTAIVADPTGGVFAIQEKEL